MRINAEGISDGLFYGGAPVCTWRDHRKQYKAGCVLNLIHAGAAESSPKNSVHYKKSWKQASVLQSLHTSGVGMKL
jgi:hypothetical protein